MQCKNISIFYIKRQKTIIIRPLLILNRFQILKICVFLRLPIYIDSTNKLINFRRNRLRYQIVPLCKVFFNPRIDITLNRFISIMNSENSYFVTHLKIFQKFFKINKFNSRNLINKRNKKWIVFLPFALQKKIYRQLLTSHLRSLTFDEVEFLLKINLFFK